ncbi:MAG: helix-turn-helix domain-containing protein [Gemmatimonadales bacterium]|nr:helix-turn-helix domain-containing protein [Gemmatimonadales bacterium]MBT3497636.1 helix-turn-helix domain-containing protein [Gemmatimonadales bacterium]MBT6694316.1 helix-turn-helix domain-containing protein [Gemmatimonadales bacterium]MBT7692691.1 helix-turn-helix domain-containing protein [Gemmatimonadales bacterium]
MSNSPAQLPPVSASATSFFAIMRLILAHYTSEPDDALPGTWRAELRSLALAFDNAMSVDPVIQDAIVRYMGAPKGLNVLIALLSQPSVHRGPRDTLRHMRQDVPRDANLAALVGVLEPRIAKVIAPAIEQRLSQPQCLDLVRSALRDLFAPKHLPSLLALIHELGKPDLLPVVQDLARLSAESVTEDALPQFTKLMAGIACSAVGDSSPSDMAEGLAEPCVAWARLVVQSWIHDDPDEWLDMQQAADYLGIRPRTLHVHIRNHAGKASELPVERRTGPGYRGHGKYFIRTGDLNDWATTHWQSPRKRVLAAISSRT